MPSAFQTQYRASRSNLQRHMNSALQLPSCPAMPCPLLLRFGTFRYIQALNRSVALQHAKFQALPTSVLFRIYVVHLYTMNSNWEQAEKRSTAWMNLHLTIQKSCWSKLQIGTLLSKMPGGDKIRPCTVASVFVLGAQWAVKVLQVSYLFIFLSYLSFRSCSILNLHPTTCITCFTA